MCQLSIDPGRSQSVLLQLLVQRRLRLLRCSSWVAAACCPAAPEPPAQHGQQLQANWLPAAVGPLGWCKERGRKGGQGWGRLHHGAGCQLNPAIHAASTLGCCLSCCCRSNQSPTPLPLRWPACNLCGLLPCPTHLCVIVLPHFARNFVAPQVEGLEVDARYLQFLRGWEGQQGMQGNCQVVEGDQLLGVLWCRGLTSDVGICVGCSVTRRSSLSMCISVVLPALSSPCDRPREAAALGEPQLHAGARATSKRSAHQEQNLGVFVVQSQCVQSAVNPANQARQRMMS